MRYDVIVVGGGPAGSTMAYHLARSGLSVLLLEMKSYPRYKPCGGGLAQKAARLIDFPWREVVQDEACRAAFIYGTRIRVEVSCDEPAVYLMMRDEFDHLLASNASRAGAVIQDGCPCTGVRQEDGEVVVEAGKDVYRASFLAVADGVNSFCSRQLGLYGKRRPGTTLAAELSVPDRVMDRFRTSVTIDTGAVNGGYGWIFPKREYMSVGVGVFVGRTDIRRAFDNFLSCHGLEEAKMRLQRAHLIPADGGLNQPPARGRVLMLGDAAGLVDPLSGEGIYYAMYSAMLAARSIWEKYERPGELPSYYQELVDKHIRRDLAMAARLARIFYPFALPVMKLVEAQPSIAKTLLSVVYGRDTYSSSGWVQKYIRKVLLHMERDTALDHSPEGGGF